MGFAFVGDRHRLFNPETLHQDHQGVGKRLVDDLRTRVSPAEFALLNKHVLQTDTFPGQAIHSMGFLGSIITAPHGQLHAAAAQRCRAHARPQRIPGGAAEELAEGADECVDLPVPRMIGAPRSLADDLGVGSLLVSRHPCCRCRIFGVVSVPRPLATHPQHRTGAAALAREVLLPCVSHLVSQQL